MQIDLYFWNTVAKEYHSYCGRYSFLCTASETFKEAWERMRPELQQLGREFLQELPQFGHLCVDVSAYACVLFRPRDRFYSMSWHEIEDVRQEFINWNLKRCAQ